MAREEVRKAEEKTDIDENKALAAEFDELRTRKQAPSPDVRARLAEAKEKAKFVRSVMPPPSTAEVRLQSAPFMGDVIIPVTEDDAAASWDGSKQLRELEAKEAALNVELLKADAEEFQYFVRCRACYRHGIYLVGVVSDGDVVTDGKWFARYKPDPKTPWRQRILCQRCLMENNERELSIVYTDWHKGHFRVEARWLRKVPKDQLRAALEGSVRACEMPLTSQNVIGTIADPVPN